MFIKEKEDILEMYNDGKKSFFKPGRFLLTGLASAVLANAAVNLVSLDSNSVNADDGKVSYASGIVSWKANDQETIQRNMLNQGITGIDQLSNYKVVWGDTLSGIAQHFGTTVESIAFKFGITNPNFIVAGVTVENQHLLVTNETVSVPSTATQVTDFFAPSVNKNSQSYNSSTTSNSAGKTDNSKASQSVNASSSSKASDNDTNIGGASKVITDQTGVSSPAASSTPVAKPSESVPADNSSAVVPAPTAPVASSTNDDTNIGSASEVINGQTDSSSTVASATPAAKPSESMPAGDTSSVVPEPAAPVASSTDDDTNIGGASAVVNDQSDSSSPAASSTPVAKPSESVPADNSSAVTPTPKDSVASSTNDDTN
ncbi:LysM peptidoglycan-binding domain-containing protein, partial [Leuconostoc mesenteroides]|uniref:LysM peptidoglycan-binding domain-containing protein n=2 Tax=Leuconostoc mesenteroides TaxID=1245 RepID=UPI001CC1B78A